MDAHEVLVAARNLIGREGWTCGVGYRQTADRDGDAGYCINGAIGRVLGFDPGHPDVAMGVLAAMQPALGVLRGQLGGKTWLWNDSVCKTKEEALAAFDRAIAATAPLPADPFPRDVAPKAESSNPDWPAVLSGGGEHG